MVEVGAITRDGLERTAELERTIARIKEVNQLKVNFVSNISHELRTPLTQIRGYVLLMNEGLLGDLNSQQAGAIATDSAATDRLETLIEDLIRFTVAARGELVVDAQPFSLSDLAWSVITRHGS